MKNAIGKFVIGVLAVVSMYFLIPSKKENQCPWQKDFNKKALFGVVVKKFYDHSNHSVPLIILKNIKNSRLDTIDFMGDSSSVFLKLKELDTVSKKTLTNGVFIEEAGHLQKIGSVVFDCNN